MARVEKVKGLFGEEVRCSVCGGDPIAVWVGKDAIFVCERCAIEILPRLLGEAIAIAASDEGWLGFKRRLERLEKNIYRGALAAAIDLLGGEIRDDSDA